MSGLASKPVLLSLKGIAGPRSGWVKKPGHSFYCWLVRPVSLRIEDFCSAGYSTPETRAVPPKTDSIASLPTPLTLTAADVPRVDSIPFVLKSPGGTKSQPSLSHSSRHFPIT